MADMNTVAVLEKQAFKMRSTLLKLCRKTLLHIGGDLSAADMMTAIYMYKMNYNTKEVKWEKRDRFVLSKGHGAGCLYISMAMAGFWSIDDIFNDYGQLNSRFGMHPCKNQNSGMDVSSGSLGHGISLAVGMALAAKRKNQNHRIFTVLGDGELYEGSVWEGALAASAYELGNVVAFVDRNKVCFNGFTEDKVYGLKLEPITEKWKAFGWNVVEIDGNNMEQIVDALDNIPAVDSRQPTVVIGNTVKGKGVRFMENNPSWHSGKLSDEQYELALKQLCEAYKTEEKL